MYFSRPTGEVSEPKSYSLTIKKSEPWGRTKESLLASCNGLYVTKKADITHTTYTYQDELKTRREVDQLTILRTTLGNSDTSSEPKSSDEYSENGLHQRLHQTMAEDGFSSPLLAELSKLQELLKNEKALEFIEKTRAFVSEVDGGRTRNLRIDSPVL